MNETTKTNLKSVLLNCINEGVVANRYEAIRFCYHYLRIDGDNSVPFWCFEYVHQLFWDGYLED